MINDILLFTYALVIILLAFSTLFVTVTIIVNVMASYQAYSFFIIGIGLIYLGARSD